MTTSGHQVLIGTLKRLLSPRRDGRRRPVSGAMTKKGFRLDIQGVRGLALVLVLMTHAELPFSHGGYVGLDVFFVLSGFLITGLIVTEFERKGSFSALNFYARRAKRILPLVATVLFAVVVASVLLFSVVRREQVAGEVIAASLYVVNWTFAFRNVDYFAFQATDVSPVQHYWSLSVEEQFYLVWPLLLIVGAAWATRSGRQLRFTTFIVVAPVAILSLAYSIWFTTVAQQAAYFSTFTRVWELAIGGLLALLLPLGITMRRSVSTALAGGALLILFATTVLFDGNTPYPGWRGLFPVLATVAFIVAGTATTMSAPVRLLARSPFQYLGRISYAWYLWHWPVIVFGIEVLGSSSIPTLIFLTLLAWIPSEITHRLIEEPFRRSRWLGLRPKQALAVGLGCTLGTAALGVGVQLSKPKIETASAEEAVGAHAVVNRGERIQRRADAVRPHPLNAVYDWGALVDDDCRSRTEPGSCVYGNPRSKTTVVIWGDSHAVQYFPTMETIAERRGWRLVGLVRADCTVADVEYQPGCDEWRGEALERIRRERPKLVVISTATASSYRVIFDGEKLSRDRSEPHLRSGFARTLARLRRETGAKVSVIRDQARAPSLPAECVAESLKKLERCAFEAERNEEWAYDVRGADRVPGVKAIDPMPVLCPWQGRCPAVIGNVVVYRDQYHLTATFARTLGPWLERELPDPEGGAGSAPAAPAGPP